MTVRAPVARLTVGMPAYNGEKFIAEAIGSVLSQSYQDIVLLISDNASTAGTRRGAHSRR